MDQRRTSLVTAAMAALLLVAGPVAAAEDEAPVDETEAPAEDTGASAEEDRKLRVAQTPRDQVGLILLGSLLVGGGLALVNARRQLKGKRPQASGEFRWR